MTIRRISVIIKGICKGPVTLVPISIKRKYCWSFLLKTALAVLSVVFNLLNWSLCWLLYSFAEAQHNGKLHQETVFLKNYQCVHQN